MSVLLAGLPDDITEATIAQLLMQGDEVRVLEPSRHSEARWKAAGAFVAVGRYDDDDLFERAATGCRSVVLGGEAFPHVPAILEGLARCASRPRLILCEMSLEPGVIPDGWESVGLSMGRAGIFKKRSAIRAEDVARAIDAADDIAQVPGDVLDLKDPGAWSELDLEPPGRDET